VNEDTTDWKDLREFKGVDLTMSFVVSWGVEAESLLIDVDLCLEPQHVFYETPRPSETACFHPATIEFPYCTKAEASNSNDGGPLSSAIRALSVGRISGLRRTGEGLYEISGTFGKVVIAAERPMVRLKNITT